MGFKLCMACGQPFWPHSQVPKQCYCSASSCQRERRRRWQQDKRRNDPDYQDNQARAQREWCHRNPDYWRKYRDAHPDYRERNRKKQRERDNRRKNPQLAKRDASTPSMVLASGIYRLSHVTTAEIAKMEEWLVEITVLSTAPSSGEHCKEKM